MSITAGQQILASDFVSTPSGASDSGKVAKLDSTGKVPNSFIHTDLIKAGETLDGTPVPVPVVIINGVHQKELRTVINFGDVSGNTRRSVTIKPLASVTSADIRMAMIKVGSPTGNLTIEVQTDSAGSPSGTPVTNGTSNTVAMSGLTGTYAETTFTFASAFTLSANTTYHIVLKRSDAVSGANYVRVLGITNDYGPFVGKKYDGGSWSSGDLMMFEMVPSSGGDKQAWRSDANVLGLHWFHGFAISDGAANADVIVQFDGIVSGLTGLRFGAKYFVQDTVGTIGVTAGTYEVGVGEAISDTTLLIKQYDDEYVGSISATQASADNFSWVGFVVVPVYIRGVRVNGSITGAGSFSLNLEAKKYGMTAPSEQSYFSTDSNSKSLDFTAYTVTVSLSTASNNGSTRGGSGTVYLYR